VVGPANDIAPTTLHHRLDSPRNRSLCQPIVSSTYSIKPFKDEVLCDISPLEVFDVLLGQLYLWKRHVVYESRNHNFIINLGRQLYEIPEVSPPTAISLISAKKCSKVISHTGNFVFFVIHAHSKKKVATTLVAYKDILSLQ
jgi:hypothetical protein